MTTSYTIRLTDPGQPSRVYQAAARSMLRVRHEARALAHGVLPGGTVQIYAGAPAELRGDEDPVLAWEV